MGVNGYYYLPGQNFANVFGPVIADIRRFTHAPLLIGETAVGPLAGQPQGIRDLFAGARAQHVLGLVWFDRTQPRRRLQAGLAAGRQPGRAGRVP